MPKLGGMAQISRPFQIGVLACAVLALAVFVALRRTGGSSTGSSSPSVSSSAGGSSSGSSASAPSGGTSSVDHGAAPGVEGLTHDIQRAHGAVTATQHNAQEVQAKAAAAPTATAGAATHASGAASAKATPSTSSTSDATPSTAKTGAAAHPATSAHHGAVPHHAPAAQPSAAATAALTLHNLTAALHLNAVVDLVEVLDPALRVKAKVAHAESDFIARMKADLRPASQATVAAELHRGKTVLLLFVNPHSYDDDATAIGTVEVASKLHHKVVAHIALANQVNSFGSVTRAIQVYQTPTLLIVNPRRQVTTITGLTNEFALEQAIAEAKG
jgi:hypothetical protein